MPVTSGVFSLPEIHYQGFDFFEVGNACNLGLVYSPCGESMFRVLTFSGSRSPPKWRSRHSPTLLASPLPHDRSHTPQ